MAEPSATRGIIRIAVSAAVAAGTVAVLLAARSNTSRAVPAHAAALVRGNAPGEWRYWGADAWSTRYSPLDQIDASNFNSLQIAWQWSAGQFGEDEYFRSTPLFAKGRLFTVATNRRKAFALDPATGKMLWKWEMNEGIRWQKAPRRYAGRGLAYWTSGSEERVIVVTPGYHLASLDARAR